ncbi:hypothetical protein BDV93DRAFT_527861 [Ceratobasidium sp. AG-I]|nr:hypothetical protein BDV93DRAFT_527861 [Ceratobasidium sp. AG-I]
MAQTEAQILEEISRLSGAIDRHKSQTQHAPRGGYRGARPYAPPSYRKPYAHPASVGGASQANPPQEVVLGGEVFQSSRGGKSLVRKGAPTASRPSSRQAYKPPTSQPSSTSSTPAPSTIPLPSTVEYVHAGKNKLVAANRINKPKPRPPPAAVLAVKRARLAKMSATMNNVQAHRNQRAYGKRKMTLKRRKTVDKPCRYWTRTGICQKANTCPYQHDPNKTAICPRFVNGDCPNDALTCPLSHDPTPERMPLCVHFQNAGRCRLGNACPYPHIRVAPESKTGVCRDFAVLGFCERGIECDKNHVRECPDFAERGECGDKTCKLPHVIRANKGKMAAAAAAKDLVKVEDVKREESLAIGPASKLGDEFVSLTFEESDDSDAEESGDEEEDEEEGATSGAEAEVDADAETGDEIVQGEEDEHDVDALLSEDAEMM